MNKIGIRVNLSGWRLSAVACVLAFGIAVVIEPARWASALAFVSAAFLLGSLIDRLPFKAYCVAQAILLTLIAAANAWNGRNLMAVLSGCAALIFVGACIFRSWRDRRREGRRAGSSTYSKR